MEKVIECIPNISEGKDMDVIDRIAATFLNFSKVRLLDIDTGKSANRTVFTFAGDPPEVVEAAFQLIKTSTGLIDMSKHSGEHPRFGAVDVCPLVPIRNMDMDETIVLARNLAERVGKELDIPAYCYEYAAFTGKRRNLSHVRKLEYESLKHHYHKSEWTPDFGPHTFNEKTGAIAIGARKLLIAYNVNLSTADAAIAKKIAGEVRESGVLVNKDGKQSRKKGALKAVKAIGWYMKEFRKAQISMNLTDIEQTPVHIAFEKIRELASKYHTEVTGSELVGMIPLVSLTEAGAFYHQRYRLTWEPNEQRLLDLAIHALGLHEVKPFRMDEKIIEYALNLST